MIDIQKYIYWLNTKDYDLKKEVVWREMYSRIGRIFHINQMIEYNIANIIAIEELEKKNNKAFTENDSIELKAIIDEKFDELSKLTFDELKILLTNSIYLKEVDMDKLEKIIQYRDYLAYTCFKEKALVDEISTVEEVDKFVDELNDHVVLIEDFNKWIIQIFEKNNIIQILLQK